MYVRTGLHWLWGCLEALPAAVGTGTAVGMVSRHVGGCGQKQDVVGRNMYVWVWLCGKMEQHAKGKTFGEKITLYQVIFKGCEFCEFEIATIRGKLFPKICQFRNC